MHRCSLYVLAKKPKALINLFLCGLVVVLTTMGGVRTAYGQHPVSRTVQRVTSYSSMDGLAHNNIADILVDSRGYVWVCTWCGISRYDGYRFKNYLTVPDPTQPISHTRFVSVQEDGQGHLWFRTYDNHLCKFNRYTEQFEVPVPEKAGAMLCDEAGRTWIECLDKGLVLADAPNNVLIAEPINYLLQGAGRVWAVAGGRTLYTLHTHADGSCHAEQVAQTDADVVGTALLANGLCLATAQGLWAVDTLGQVRRAAVPQTVSCLTAVPERAGSAADTVYVGTAQGGLYVWAVGQVQVQACAVPGGFSHRVRSLTPDSHGLLWVVTTQAGITRYDPQRHHARHFQQPNYAATYYTDTTALVVERDDVVWVKMNQVGFGYYDRLNDCIVPYFNSPLAPDYSMSNGVSCFEIDRDNVLWLSTSYERGLKRIMPASLSNVHDQAPEEVRALLLDSRQRVWMGTKNGELFCNDRDGQRAYTVTSDKPLGRIYSLMEDTRGCIWVGTKGNGAYCLTPNQRDGYDMTRYEHRDSDPYSLSSNEIYCITEDFQGNLWFATYGGAINKMDSRQPGRFYNIANSFPHYPDEMCLRARYIFSDTPERMYVATVEGLIQLNPSLPPEQVEFKLIQRQWGVSDGLSNNDIIQLFKDSQGRVWLSTYGGGLQCITGYDASGMPLFETYTTQQGLASNVVLATVEDHQGNIWSLTEAGPSRMNPQEQVFTNYSSFNETQPLLFNETAALIDARGQLLFGSNKWLHTLDPQAVYPLDYDFRLRFTGLDIQNNPVTVGTERSPLEVSLSEQGAIRLPYDYLIFKIEFAALNYRIQDRVSYMYRLEGFDKNWNVVHDVHSATYSHVPPGRYAFHLKAFVGNQLMAGGDIQTAIRVVAPPWQQWWAYVLYALLVLGVLFLVYRLMYTMARLRSDVSIRQDMTEMKLKFFTNISHELRTPLSLIIGGIEEVQNREQLTDRGEKSLNLAYKNSKRMLTLINQLLDFRKIVKDKMELKISRVDIVPIAEHVLEDFREMAREHQIELLFAVSHKSIFVWVDPQRMESVFYNLISNAFKFTPDKGRIEVSLSNRIQDGQMLLQVKDNGIGISKDKVATIFDRFSQGGASVRGDRGSGIGLALCKEIVELHHGTIEVESKHNAGSLFTVTLMLGNSHFDMSQINFLSTDGPQRETQYMVDDTTIMQTNRLTATPPPDAQTLLLVDDNHELRTFIYNHLIDTYKILEASDGVEALQVIVREHPDIIVTDLMMPRMDGIDMINKVRHDFETSHIPIIMLTAKHEEQARIQAMTYGADGYITKPFSIDLLSARIDNLLTQRRVLFEKYSSLSARNQVAELMHKDVVVTDLDEDFLKKVVQWMDQNIDNSDVTIDQLAGHLKLGRTTMYNKLKSLTGKSPVELIKEYRITKSKLFLKTGQYSVSEVAYMVGFSDPGYFCKCFKEQFKMAPAEYLKTHHLKQ